MSCRRAAKPLLLQPLWPPRVVVLKHSTAPRKQKHPPNKNNKNIKPTTSLLKYQIAAVRLFDANNGSHCCNYSKKHIGLKQPHRMINTYVLYHGVSESHCHGSAEEMAFSAQHQGDTNGFQQKISAHNEMCTQNVIKYAK